MAFANVPIYPQGGPQAWGAEIQNSTGTGLVTLVTGGANGTIVEAMNVSSTDGTLAHTFLVYLTNGGINYQLGAVSIPISAGNVTGTPAVDILRSGQFPGLPVDANGNYVIYVPNGWTLTCSVSAAVTTADFMYITAQGVNY